MTSCVNTAAIMNICPMDLPIKKRALDLLTWSTINVTSAPICSPTIFNCPSSAAVAAVNREEEQNNSYQLEAKEPENETQPDPEQSKSDSSSIRNDQNTVSCTMNLQPSPKEPNSSTNNSQQLLNEPNASMRVGINLAIISNVKKKWLQRYETDGMDRNEDTHNNEAQNVVTKDKTQNNESSDIVTNKDTSVSRVLRIRRREKSENRLSERKCRASERLHKGLKYQQYLAMNRPNGRRRKSDMKIEELTPLPRKRGRPRNEKKVITENAPSGSSEVPIVALQEKDEETARQNGKQRRLSLRSS